jgi:hypothetical protein
VPDVGEDEVIAVSKGGWGEVESPGFAWSLMRNTVSRGGFEVVEERAEG